VFDSTDNATVEALVVNAAEASTRDTDTGQERDRTVRSRNWNTGFRSSSSPLA